MAIGIIGGLVDLAAGLALFAGSMGPSSMASDWAAAGLIGLGVAVLATAVALAFAPEDRPRTAYGGLMLVYGVLMLALGAVMLAGMLPMMAGSLVSGAALILVGVAMLYSGATMARM